MLHNLPGEKLAEIAADLKVNDLSSLLATNKFFYALASNTDFFREWNIHADINIQNNKIKLMDAMVISVLENYGKSKRDLPSLSIYFSLLKNSQQANEVEKVIKSISGWKESSDAGVFIPFAVGTVLIGVPTVVLGVTVGAGTAFLYAFGSMFPIAIATQCGYRGILNAMKRNHEKKQSSYAKQLSVLLKNSNEKESENVQEVVVENMDEKSSLLGSSQPTSEYGSARATTIGTGLTFVGRDRQQTINDETIIEMEDKSEHLYQAAASGL